MKTNYELRYASHPEDAKNYDTERLRRDFLITNIFTPNEVNMVYSMYDRTVVGGAYTKSESLTLEAIVPLKAEYFLERREIGIFNVSKGQGVITVDGTEYTLEYKEALYIGSGAKEVIFGSADESQPAKFYFVSSVAHRSCPTVKITRENTITTELGSLETANHRIINKMIVNQVLDSCQLQMGMTELKTGSVWNTMPPHTHDRRMEVYFYFELPEEQAVCHFMGEPTQTRHIWMGGEQAVLSPEWSIHSATATTSYTFIWGMGGENLDYSDQDFYKYSELR
ncbi:MAG: 5-dehydro-4-deoxy-D-glucuronate isomerase [Rikenellaceae bacterium]